jgi:hypothetical protein
MSTTQPVSDVEYIVRLNRHTNGHWPSRPEDATADAMIKVSIGIALARLEAMDADDMFGDDATKESKALHFAQLTAMQGWYQTVVALKALVAVDTVKANAVAYDIWSAADAGDSYGEWLWQWAVENDIPVHPDTLGNQTQEQAKANVEAMHERLGSQNDEECDGCSCHKAAPCSHCVEHLDENLKARCERG